MEKTTDGHVRSTDVRSAGEIEKVGGEKVE